MKGLENFGAFALTRGEMKSVSGGATCHVRTATGSVTITGKGSASSFAAAAKWQAKQPGYAGNWCCQSCGSATWCKGC